MPRFLHALIPSVIRSTSSSLSLSASSLRATSSSGCALRHLKFKSRGTITTSDYWDRSLASSLSQFQSFRTIVTEARPRPRSNPTADHSAQKTSGHGTPPPPPPPVYAVIMPWYFRQWVWLIVGLDLAWVVFEADSIWNHFVDRVQNEDGTVAWEPKPVWQRAGGAAFVAFGGGFFAVGVLLARSRNVRLIAFRDRGQRVYLETASHRVNGGKLFDRADCVLLPNKSDDFMDLIVKGARGRYPLRLARAEVDGIPGDVFDIRKRLHQRWYSKAS